MDVSSQLLQQHAAKDNDFLFNIMNGDESWFHHFNLEMKQQRME
jgi:hypothetical protein